MQKALYIFFILANFSTDLHAQIADSTTHSLIAIRKKDFSLLTGGNFGRYSFIDIGFSINEYGWSRHPYSFDYYISNEIKIAKKSIIGPKIGVWIAGGFAFGANLIYYTDFTKSCLVFRPELGTGLGKAKLVYGYNWQLINKDFSGINKHLFSLVYCFNLKRLKNMSTSMANIRTR